MLLTYGMDAWFPHSVDHTVVLAPMGGSDLMAANASGDLPKRDVVQKTRNS